MKSREVRESGENGAGPMPFAFQFYSNSEAKAGVCPWEICDPLTSFNAVCGIPIWYKTFRFLRVYHTWEEVLATISPKHMQH